MAGLVRNRTTDVRIPGPQGVTASDMSQQVYHDSMRINPTLASQTVYHGKYGELTVPATMYATTQTPMKALNVVPSTPNRQSNASIVDSKFHRDGLVYLGEYDPRDEPTPQMNRPVCSSKFQPHLIGPRTNFVQNLKWYIAYPAATVMFGGKHNLGLSIRVPQIVTRQTGGPGPGVMRPYPRFARVQRIPRYSTAPQAYPTKSAGA